MRTVRGFFSSQGFRGSWSITYSGRIYLILFRIGSTLAYILDLIMLVAVPKNLDGRLDTPRTRPALDGALWPQPMEKLHMPHDQQHTESKSRHAYLCALQFCSLNS